MTLRSWLRPTPNPLFPDALPADALFLGEAPGVVALCRYGDVPETQWTRADVFTSEWNLRIRRLGDAARTVAAGSVPGLSQFGEAGREASLDEAGDDPKRVVLWGRRNAGETQWLELRVPHLMTPESDLHPRGHGTEHTGQMVRRCLVAAPHEVSDEESSDRPFYRYAGLAYAETDADDTFLEPISG